MLLLRHTGILLLGLIAFVLFASPAGGQSLWGANLLSYFEKPIRTVILIVLTVLGSSLVFFTTKTKKVKAARPSKAAKTSESSTDQTANSETHSIIDRLLEWPVLLALCFAGVCFAFPLEWSLLGDATLFIGYNYRFDTTGELVTPGRELLSALISQGLYKLLSIWYGGKLDSIFSFQIISAVAALFWCFISVKLVRLIIDSAVPDARWLRLLGLVLLLTSGGSLFFFAYVEVYPLPYAATLGVIYACFRYMRKESGLTIVMAALVLAMLLHLQNALLLPGIVYLILKRRDPEFDISWRWIAGASAILLAVYAYSQINPIVTLTTADNPFIPFRPVQDFNYTLFSGQHLLDLLNEHLLLAPIAILLGIALLIQRPDLRKSELRFVTITLFFFEAYLIGGNLVFGLARDWDTVAIIGPLFVIFSLLMLRQITLDIRAAKRLSYIVSVASILFFAQWLTVNQNLAYSLTRYKAILEHYEPLITKRNSHYGWENVRKVLKYFPPSQELFVINEMLRLQPWPITTSRVVEIAIQRSNEIEPLGYSQMKKIRDQILVMNDSLLLIEEVGEDKLRVDAKHSANVLNHADIFNFIVAFESTTARQIDSTKAYALANEFIRRHPSLPQGYELMAKLKLTFAPKEQHVIDSMARLAISIDPERPRPYSYLASIQLKRKDYEGVRASMRKALTLDPEWITATIMFGQFVQIVPQEYRYKEDIEMIESSSNRILKRAQGKDIVVEGATKEMDEILESMRKLKPTAK